MPLESELPAFQRMPIDFLRIPALPVQQNPKKQLEKAKKFLTAFDPSPLVVTGGEILFWGGTLVGTESNRRHKGRRHHQRQVAYRLELRRTFRWSNTIARADFRAATVERAPLVGNPA